MSRFYINQGISHSVENEGGGLHVKKLISVDRNYLTVIEERNGIYCTIFIRYEGGSAKTSKWDANWGIGLPENAYEVDDIEKLRNEIFVYML